MHAARPVRVLWRGKRSSHLVNVAKEAAANIAHARKKRVRWSEEEARGVAARRTAFLFTCAAAAGAAALRPLSLPSLPRPLRAACCCGLMAFRLSPSPLFCTLESIKALSLQRSSGFDDLLQIGTREKGEIEREAFKKRFGQEQRSTPARLCRFHCPSPNHITEAFHP